MFHKISFKLKFLIGILLVIGIASALFTSNTSLFQGKLNSGPRKVMPISQNSSSVAVLASQQAKLVFQSLMPTQQITVAPVDSCPASDWHKIGAWTTWVGVPDNSAQLGYSKPIIPTTIKLLSMGFRVSTPIGSTSIPASEHYKFVITNTLGATLYEYEGDWNQPTMQPGLNNGNNFLNLSSNENYLFYLYAKPFYPQELERTGVHYLESRILSAAIEINGQRSDADAFDNVVNIGTGQVRLYNPQPSALTPCPTLQVIN